MILICIDLTENLYYNRFQELIEEAIALSKKQAYPVNQLKMFINTINDLSAELLLQEALTDFNKKLYKDKIEEALLERDEEKFNTYTSLLNEITENELVKYH